MSFDRLRISPERPLVFFYYSGHGDAQDLHLAGARLSLVELRGAVAAISAKVSVLLVDSCESGAMTREKGATLGPSWEINLLQDPEIKGRIVITSSSASEVAQESDRLEGSFFTFNWVAGLYGAADVNGDGIVTLEEAYRYAHFKTIEQTIGSRGGVQHPSYAFDLAGQGNLVLASLSSSTAELDLAASATSGSYFVLDADKQLLLTEIVQGGERTASLRLPPGRYRVRKREQDRYLVLDVALATGDRRLIRDLDMSPVVYGPDRGGKGAEPDDGGQTTWSGREHGPRLGLGMRSGFSAGMDPTPELEVSYRFTMGHLFVSPRLALRSATVRTQTDTVSQGEVEAGLGIGWIGRLGRVPAAVGLDAGVLAFSQSNSVEATLPQNPPTGAFSAGLVLGGSIEVGLPFDGPWRVFLYGRSGAVRFELDQASKLGFFLGGGLGAGYAFR